MSNIINFTREDCKAFSLKIANAGYDDYSILFRKLLEEMEKNAYD